MAKFAAPAVNIHLAEILRTAKAWLQCRSDACWSIRLWACLSDDLNQYASNSRREQAFVVPHE